MAELMKQLVEQLMAMAASNKKNKKNKGRDSKADDGDDKKSDDDKGGGAGGGPPGFIKSAIRKVIEAFRPIVRITNVHIRYEDLEEDAVDLQERDAPLALGVTIGRLMLQHPDSPYSEIDEDPNMMPCKDVVPLEVNVDGLGVYMHTAAMGVESVIGGGPDAQAAARAAQSDEEARRRLSAKEKARMEATNGGEDDRTAAAMGALLGEMLAPSSGRPAHEWLIRPISVSGKVHVNTGLFIKARTAFDWPHLAVADLEVGPIQVQISEHQASSLLIAASELMLMPARNLYAMLRPKAFHARRVWRAAINAVVYGGLISVSGATRMSNAIRDRVGYQTVLQEALAKLSASGGGGGGGGSMQMEDVMHVTTEGKGAISLARADTAGGAAIDALLEVDAITSPMQVALWRLIAFSEAKSAAEQEKLMGKRGKNARALFAGASRKAMGAATSDDMMAASNAVQLEDGGEGEGEGDDPLAGAPPHFALAVVSLRVAEVSASLLLDDSARVLSAEEAAAMAAAEAAAAAKTRTEVVTTHNLDGTTTTTTMVTVHHPPVTNEPISTVLGARLSPIVVRARLTPKAEIATALHAAVGAVTVEHQAGRGSNRRQALLTLPGETHIPDTSPLLGPPMPDVEVPRPSVFGFFSSAASALKKVARRDDAAYADAAAEGGGGAAPLPPAIHAVVTLPQEPPPGGLPPTARRAPTFTVHRGSRGWRRTSCTSSSAPSLARSMPRWI